MTMEAPETPQRPIPRRQAGILLHPTSLPGPWGSGDLGEHAYRFVDFLAAAGQQVWQILPLGPTHHDGSPYQSLSVHAGNPTLISIEALAAEGWLEGEVVPRPNWDHKRDLLHQAWRGFGAHADETARADYGRFLEENAHWLEDFALYRALKHEYDSRGWPEWPAGVRDREPPALDEARRRHAESLDYVRFEQFAFYRQWMALKRYANEHGVKVFGDMPIFVAHDSADVWARRENFLLDAEGHPTVVAGVPPDYFSETGQRWGNPHYDWARLEADGFGWWFERMETQLRLFDLVRIDHFRGFEAYWEVPADEETAINGRWVQAPGEAFFSALRRRFDPLPLVAEDLGIITEAVTALRCKFALPGMKILQFAFDSGPDNPYLPHNIEENSVVYTGTHDNDTTVGWFDTLAPGPQAYIREYLGEPGEPMPWALIRAAFASVGVLAVVPMQDVLALDSRHRMNRPGTTEGNWGWRFEWEWLPERLAGRLHRLAEVYGRLG